MFGVPCSVSVHVWPAVTRPVTPRRYSVVATTFWSFVAGHSSFELIAIVFSGAAGLRLGLAVVAPGNLSRKAALVAAAKPAVRMMYGAAIMFMIAAFVEAFWSPLTEVPFRIKIAVGITAWLVLLVYFAFAGRARATR